MPFDVVIIGGGLAGCSAARQLARHGHTVCLLEQHTYPRHKLCGEFLSPEAQASFRRLDVLDDVMAAGARPIHQTRLTAPNGSATDHALPAPALGLSRYRLDTLLFERACDAGVDGRTGTRATGIQGSLHEGFVVDTTTGPVRGRVVLGAYGRRTRLDRSLNRPFLNVSSPYVGFKAHYKGPGVPETIELHSAPGGYCGVSPVEDDRANVCWIGRVDALKAAGGTPEGMLSDLRQNPDLDARLKNLTRVSDQFEAVSQVPLMPKSRFVDDICMVGDAAGMIAPLCGDGMAMALQAADLATPLVSDFVADQRPAASFRREYNRQWRNTFGVRMRLGRWVHTAAFRPGAASTLVRACHWLPPLARWLIRSTRG
ncbi:MAG: NAD(P)/FAD-dependent oxidoreductase [Salinibacter sp.]